MSKAERTRRFIIEKVAPVFNKKGYSATSLVDLTGATGLTKGSIYGNFKDKNEVALEAFQYNLRFMTSELNKQVEAHTTAGAKLHAFLDYYQSDYQRIFQNGGCSILNTAIESDYMYPELRKAACTALINWKNRIHDIVEQGLKSGELTSGDAERFSCLFVSLVEGTVFVSKALNESKYIYFNIEHLKNQVDAMMH